MKRILAITLTLVMVLAALTGCMASQNPSGKSTPMTLTIAETLPSCVAFEYKDGKPYCFYAYDPEGKLYRVFWTDFTGLHEKDVILVDHADGVKALTYEEYPSGWTPQYEITASRITPHEMASCISGKDGAYILTLPKSGQKITLRDELRRFVPYITDALVAAAESKIADNISKYNNSGFYLQVIDDYLCLSAEVIKQLDKPDDNVGCIDHEHLFFSERITPCPVRAQTDTRPEYAEGSEVLRYLSQYLNDINFVPGLSQSEFISQIEGYTYHDTIVTDIILGAHYDDVSGGGWQASGDLFGFYNDYAVTEDEKHANYSNRLSTKVQLKGLPLPFEIEFGDSLEDTFKTFGIAYSGFTPDKNSDTNMTLYSDSTSTLLFQNLKEAKEPVDYEFSYVLIYTETYDIQQDVGKPIVVERTVKLGFDDSENAHLGLLEVCVNEFRTLA